MSSFSKITTKQIQTVCKSFNKENIGILLNLLKKENPNEIKEISENIISTCAMLLLLKKDDVDTIKQLLGISYILLNSLTDKSYDVITTEVQLLLNEKNPINTMKLLTILAEEDTSSLDDNIVQYTISYCYIILVLLIFYSYLF